MTTGHDAEEPEDWESDDWARRSSRATCPRARHPLALQHGRRPTCCRRSSSADRGAAARLPRAAAVRAARLPAADVACRARPGWTPAASASRSAPRSSPRSGSCCCSAARWQGRQLVSAEWIDQATSRQVPNGIRATPGLEPGLRIPVLEVPARRVPWRRRVRPVRRRPSRTRCGRHDDRRAPRHGSRRSTPSGRRCCRRSTRSSPTEVPLPRPMPTVGGETRDTDVEFAYDGPVGRLRISDDFSEWTDPTCASRPTSGCRAHASPTRRRPALVRRPGRRVRRLARRQVRRRTADAGGCRHVPARGDGVRSTTITRDVGFEGTRSGKAIRARLSRMPRAPSPTTSPRRTRTTSTRWSRCSPPDCVYYFGNATRRGAEEVRAYSRTPGGRSSTRSTRSTTWSGCSRRSGCRDGGVPLHLARRVGREAGIRRGAGHERVRAPRRGWLLVHEHLSPMP